MGRPTEWDEGRVLAAMQIWAVRHGRPPKRRDWNSGGDGHPAGQAVYRAFGSWGAALVAAGFQEPPAGPPRPPGGWTEGDVLDAILDWVDRFGAPPTLCSWSPSLARSLGYHEMADFFDAERPRYPLASRATRLFGTWNAALQAAGQRTTQTGLRRSTPRPRMAPPGTHTSAWTRDDIVAAVQAHARKHGRPPTYDGWAGADPHGRRPTAGTVFELFGSWRAGVLAAGLTPRSYTRRRTDSVTD